MSVPVESHSNVQEAVKVVIVDDNADIRVLLRLTFELDDRFEVVGEGANGLEAVELADKFRPHLMILDPQMTELGGLEAQPLNADKLTSPLTILYKRAAHTTTLEAALH